MNSFNSESSYYIIETFSFSSVHFKVCMCIFLPTSSCSECSLFFVIMFFFQYSQVMTLVSVVVKNSTRNYKQPSDMRTL